MMGAILYSPDQIALVPACCLSFLTSVMENDVKEMAELPTLLNNPNKEGRKQHTHSLLPFEVDCQQDETINFQRNGRSGNTVLNRETKKTADSNEVDSKQNFYFQMKNFMDYEK